MTVDASISSLSDASRLRRKNLSIGPNDEFVNVAELDPTIELDIRYATTRNFVHKRIYPRAVCLLRRAVANALVRAQQKLQKAGYGLKLWDCYRPFSVQEVFWRLVPNPQYVAKPVRGSTGKMISGSKHNRGAAIDVTLVTADGAELEMPTDHDDFSRRAHRRSPHSDKVKAHLERLTDALVDEGFTPIKSEWWHFDGARWRSFPLADIPF